MFSMAFVAFTPKGGCPLKHKDCTPSLLVDVDSVAFTPKGGCPLKPASFSNIHKGSQRP